MILTKTWTFPCLAPTNAKSLPGRCQGHQGPGPPIRQPSSLQPSSTLGVWLEPARQFFFMSVDDFCWAKRLYSAICLFSGQCLYFEQKAQQKDSLWFTYITKRHAISSRCDPKSMWLMTEIFRHCLQNGQRIHKKSTPIYKSSPSENLISDVPNFSELGYQHRHLLPSQGALCRVPCSETYDCDDKCETASEGSWRLRLRIVTGKQWETLMLKLLKMMVEHVEYDDWKVSMIHSLVLRWEYNGHMAVATLHSGFQLYGII